jgi:hypothetical protein
VTRRLLAAAALAVALTPVAASATGYTVRNPVDGCTHSVYVPDITVRYIGGWPGVSWYGSPTYWSTCP